VIVNSAIIPSPFDFRYPLAQAQAVNRRFSICLAEGQTTPPIIRRTGAFGRKIGFFHTARYDSQDTNDEHNYPAHLVALPVETWDLADEHRLSKPARTPSLGLRSRAIVDGRLYFAAESTGAAGNNQSLKPLGLKVFRYLEPIGVTGSIAAGSETIFAVTGGEVPK